MEIDGLVLESKYPELQYTIKGPLTTMWRDGFPVQEPKHLPLFFDRYLCEIDQMAKDQEWTEEDKMFVGRSLEAALKDPAFRDMWVHQSPKPPKPWPTYDETHHNQIASVAAAVGMVSEALAYETRGRTPRESVVKKLEELVEESNEHSAPAESDEIVAV